MWELSDVNDKARLKKDKRAFCYLITFLLTWSYNA